LEDFGRGTRGVVPMGRGHFFGGRMLSAQNCIGLANSAMRGSHLWIAAVVGQPQKAAACFARRVKRVWQKYFPFRMAEIMI